MIPIDELKNYFQRNKERILEDYFTFLRFKSISTDPDYAKEVIACANWVAEYLQKIGFKVEQWPTVGYPVIFASHLEAGSQKPTLLLYQHYDVQPVDPISEWNSPPFEPTIRDGQVFARGAQDNKGQCFYTLLALKYLMEQKKSLPINIKLCIEGEEECGSKGLYQVLEQKSKDLKADFLAIVDVGTKGQNSPSISLGVRGMITMEVEVDGTNTDLHSGCYGGLAYNPIRALAEMVASLKDSTGKVTIPHFYDDVSELSAEERAKISWDFDPLAYEKSNGAPPNGGEQTFSPLERNWIRPTLEINGMWGGYTGKGFKTVIPSKAYAKLSCRLVSDQEPQKIGQLVANHLKSIAPAGIKVKVNLHHGGKAVRTKLNSKGVESFAQAFSAVFQKPCEFVLEGATIPVAPALAQASKSEVVLVGLGLADDQIHAPNEHFGIDRIEKGFFIIIRAIENLSN